MKRLLALALALFPAFAAAQTIDYDIANQTFPAFRADLNDHLGAIVEHNAGTTAPATTFPYMVWVDTSGATPIYKYRNAADSAWITAFEIEAAASEWLGKVTTSSATITGGTIDGTPIGNTTPAAGTFTTLDTTSDISLTEVTPTVFLYDTDEPVARRGTSLQRNGLTFTIATRDSAGTLVTSDYVLTTSNSGATEHSFRIEGVEKLEIDSAGDTRVHDNLYALGQIIVSGTVFPSVSGSVNIGSTAFRFSNIYLSNAPNVSSDARLKNSIEDVAAAECRVADRIQIRRYKLNSEPDGPWHFGAIAQEVIAAFDAEGLNWQDYAIVTGSEADTYGVAYDELQSLKLACM